MRKALIIAQREYLAMVRTKAFIFSLLLMPVLLTISLAVQSYLTQRRNMTDKNVVVVDGTGRLFETLLEQSRQRNEHELIDRQTGLRARPAIVLEKSPATCPGDDLRVALSERIRHNQIAAFVEIDPGAIDAPMPATSQPSAGIRVYTESITYNEIFDWLTRSINQSVARLRMQAAGLDPAVVAGALAPLPAQNLGLYSRNPQGQITRASESSRVVAFIVPMALMMIMFMSLMLVTQPMLTSVLEEKQQRIAEVLLGSASPLQIMAGKLLGLVAVALTFVTIYLAGGGIAAARYDYMGLFSWHLLGWFGLFEVLACLLYGALFISIGAACNEIKDAQSLLMPVTLVLVMPMMTWVTVVEDPLGKAAVWLSLFPPATPMLMIVRLAATSMVPWWQVVLGAVLVMIATVLSVVAAGRVLRVALLMQGKAPKWHELLKWVVRG